MWCKVQYMSDKVRVIQIAVPLLAREIAELETVRRKGTMKGHWVAAAIREKLARDKEPTRERLHSGAREQEGTA
jgi:hypothetical protein